MLRATIPYYCDFAMQQVLLHRIFFKGITKNEENKTDELTLNVTFNSENIIIFYTLTGVQKRRRVVQKLFNIQDTGP